MIQVYELDGPELKEVASAKQPSGFQRGSFGAAADGGMQLAVGTQAGQLQLLDPERLDAGPLFSVQAHAGVVNALDAFGGKVRGGSAQRAKAAPKTSKVLCTPNLFALLAAEQGGSLDCDRRQGRRGAGVGPA